MSEKIQYDLEVKNNSKQTFSEVQKDTKKTDEIFSKLKNTVGEIGEQFKKSIGKEVTSSVNSLGKAITSVFTAPIKLVTMAIKLLAKYTINVLLLGGAIKGLGLLSDTLAKSGIHMFDGAIKGATDFLNLLRNPLKQAAKAVGVDLNKAADAFVLGLGGRGAIKSGKITQQGFMETYDSLTKFEKILTSLGLSLSKIDFILNFATKSFGVLGKAVSFVVDNIKPLLIGLGALGAALLTVGASWKTLMNMVKRGDEWKDAAAKIGFTIESYVAWDQILKHSGSSMQDMEMIMSNMQEKALDAAQGGKEASKAFKTIGVTVVKTNGSLKSNETILSEVMVKLSKVEDRTLRNALAIQIFGNRCRDIIPVLDKFGDNLDKTKSKLEEHNGLFNRVAEAGDKFNDTIQDIGFSFTIFKDELFIDTLEKINFFFESLTKNEGIKIFLGLVSEIAKSLMTIINTIIDLVSLITNTLNSALLGLAVTFNEVILNILKGLNKIPGVNKVVTDKMIKDAEDGFNTLFDKHIEAYKQWKESIKNLMQPPSNGKSTTQSIETPVPQIPTDTSKLRVPGVQSFNNTAYLAGLEMYYNKVQTSQIDFNQRWLEIQKEFYDADMNRLFEWLNEKNDSLSESMTNFADKYQQYSTYFTDNILNTEALAWDLHTLKVENSLKKQTEALDEWYTAQKDILDNSRLSRRAYDRKLNELDKEKAAKEKELRDKSEAERVKAAKRDLTLKIIMALANGASASMQMWADESISSIYEKIGWQVAIAGFTTAAVGLLGAQLAQFADGGIIGGNSRTGDNNLIRANSGEMVLTRDQQAQLFAMANGSTGGSRIPQNINMGDVIIEGNVTNEQLDRIGNIKSQKINELREMLEDMSFSGSLRPIIQNSGAL